MSHVTLLGLSPVAASVGLALKRAGLKMEIVGTDRDRGSMRTAEKMGAIDRSIRNLRSAMDGAQLVVLDVPLSETEEILEAVAPILEDGCVVTDVGATKTQIIEWADEYLRPEVSFVGGHPLIRKLPAAVEEADASIFDKSEYCIVPSGRANQDAVKTVVGMVEMLGARPFFLDAHEHDSYSAAMAQLPTVLAASLISMASSSPSWREVSRLAGPEFQQLSRLAAADPADSSSSCIHNAEALTYWLDKMIAELSSFREKVSEGGDELTDSFVHAWEQRARWESGELSQEPVGPEVPTMREHMAGMIVGHKWAERSRKMVKSDDRPAWKFRGRR